MNQKGLNLNISGQESNVKSIIALQGSDPPYWRATKEFFGLFITNHMGGGRLYVAFIHLSTGNLEWQL